jgi:arylsulfatase A-like enzyme
MKTHVKASLWSGLLVGLLVGFLESLFLLFNIGSFLANFLFFVKASVLYGLIGAIGGMLLGILLKGSLLRETPWGETQLKSFYFSLFLILSLFLGIVVYLLEMVFPPFVRNFNTFLSIILVGILSVSLGVVLFKFLQISKLGKGSWWIIPISAFAMVAIYEGLLWVKKGKEQHYYSARKPSVSDQKPNIIVVSMDTTRADRFSSYGHYRQTTPHIDKLAKEGQLFKNAFTPSNWTLPSHTSLFTGVYPSKHGLGYLNSYMSGDIPTLAEILSKNGYRSFSIYNNPFVGRLVGLQKGFDESVGINIDQRINLTLERLYKRLIYRDPGDHSRKTVDILSNWLIARAKMELPYFAFVHFNDVHSPYLRREPYFGEFVKDMDLSPVDLVKVRQINTRQRDFHKYLKGEVHPSLADFEYLKALYDSEIRAVDEQIGRMIHILKEKGFLKNTLIIITADHGEYLGEHHLMNHNFSLYNTGLHVPLIFWYPERIQPGVKTDYASLVDVLPTVLSMAGLKDQIPPYVQGVDLLSEGSTNPDSFTEPRAIFSEWWGWFLEGVKPDGTRPLLKEILSPDAILALTKESAKDSSKAIFYGTWKLIWLSNGKHELYNLANDPQEQKNLMEAQPEKARELQAKLEQWLGSFQQARAISDSNKKEFRQMLRSLGYVQ